MRCRQQIGDVAVRDRRAPRLTSRRVDTVEVARRLVVDVGAKRQPVVEPASRLVVQRRAEDIALGLDLVLILVDDVGSEPAIGELPRPWTARAIAVRIAQDTVRGVVGEWRLGVGARVAGVDRDIQVLEQVDLKIRAAVVALEVVRVQHAIFRVVIGREIERVPIAAAAGAETERRRRSLTQRTGLVERIIDEHSLIGGRIGAERRTRRIQRWVHDLGVSAVPVALRPRERPFDVPLLRLRRPLNRLLAHLSLLGDDLDDAARGVGTI